MNKTKKSNLSIRISDKVYEALYKEAKENVRSLSSLGEYILTKYYNENLKEKDNKNVN